MTVEMREENIVEQIQPGTETILLVEDEPIVLKMAMRMLESLGYDVLPANSPTQAIGIEKETVGRIAAWMKAPSS